MSIKQRAIWALGIVAFSYAFLNVAVRLMSEGFAPFTQVYLRIGLGCLLTIVLYYKKIHPSRFKQITKKEWIALFLMGSVGYGLAVDFVTLGALHTKLLNVAIIASTTPFFVFLFSVVLLRITFKKYLFLFLLLTFYGVSVIATKSFVPVINEFGKGEFYTLLFAIGFGVYIIARKFVSNTINNTEIAVIVMFIACITSLISALIAGERLNVSGFSNVNALLGLGIGGALNIVATKLENFGFQHINPVTGSQLMLLENVFSPIMGFFLYHEFILPAEFVGAFFVLSGVWAYIKYADD